VLQQTGNNVDANHGTVVSIRGSVVDAHFPHRLPALYTVLRAGETQDIIIEVIAHLDASTVRGIALTATRGLARGSCIVDTEQPLRVPVGERVLGRVFNVGVANGALSTTRQWPSHGRPRPRKSL
jgi:F-type H+-transporting ATPase subunit beta